VSRVGAPGAAKRRRPAAGEAADTYTPTHRYDAEVEEVPRSVSSLDEAMRDGEWLEEYEVEW
jgi:hypothetical protein